MESLIRAGSAVLAALINVASRRGRGA
jgi:hypothetical protein